jgi:hypothetical protein
MNESGATAFEVRDMARKVNTGGLRELQRFDYAGRPLEETPVERAILVEALTLLAEKKEAERRQAAQ